MARADPTPSGALTTGRANQACVGISSVLPCFRRCSWSFTALRCAESPTPATASELVRSRPGRASLLQCRPAGASSLPLPCSPAAPERSLTVAAWAATRLLVCSSRCALRPVEHRSSDVCRAGDDVRDGRAQKPLGRLDPRRPATRRVASGWLDSARGSPPTVRLVRRLWRLLVLG